ncbi:MAG: hypothetical protein Ct9H300mP32_1580 [Verrucomicrobiota bacterium]|nr:MAG: hypothetical protein Ct9H300mP32_1580 [Verrucomicrobiota bacterium]
MLSVDEGRRTAGLLRVGHDMQHKRRFAGRLRPVNLDDRPRGTPPTPSAMSRPSEPVETASICKFAPSSPSRMIEPSPKLLVMAAMADSRSAVRLSSPAVLGDAFAAIFVYPMGDLATG